MVSNSASYYHVQYKYAHDNEDCTDDNTLHATSENRSGNDGQRFVRDHISEQECHEKQVTVLANGLDLLGILFLLPGCNVSIDN